MFRCQEMYKKRSGTAGIRGHLYETKLISLIYYRLKHNDNIEEFQLATNMDDIGAFDDICFKAEVRGFDKPLVVFIQAKHKEGDNIMTYSKIELAKYFAAYLKIKKEFQQMKETFDETECLFILYTNAKDDPNYSNVYEGIFAQHLYKIIGTGGVGTQPTYEDVDMHFLCQIILKEQIAELAVQMAKNICDCAEFSMNNVLMLRFHVFLTQKVLEVSEIHAEGHRIASFQQEFFSSQEELILFFKKTLCMEVLKRQKMDESEATVATEAFYNDPYDITALSKIIGTCVTYKNGKFECIDKIPEHLKKILEQDIYVPQSIVDKALDLAANRVLKRPFKVPSMFGNRDIFIKGNATKVERRLNHLTSKMTELINKSKPNYIIPIDDNLEDGLLQLNGGLASAVGNLFVSDGKLLKITDNCESLGDLAKKLYDKLRINVNDIHAYRFEVKTNKFPQMSLETSKQDEDGVRDFMNRLIFYTNQADEKGVGNWLKEEIDVCDHNNEITMKGIQSDVMFLKFHDVIQNWWMSPEGIYLTKLSNIYEVSIKQIVKEPVMNMIHMMHEMNKKIIDYTFTKDAVDSLRLIDNQKTVITTASTLHTLIKVKQFLNDRYRSFFVINYKYILNLPVNNFITLLNEMKNIKSQKTIVILCNKMHNFRNCKRFKSIIQAVNQNTIFVINTSCFENIKNIFSETDCVINDEKINLIDMGEESKSIILQNTATFNCQNLSLTFEDSESTMPFIEGDILYRVMNGNQVIGTLNNAMLGQFLSDRTNSRRRGHVRHNSI